RVEQAADRAIRAVHSGWREWAPRVLCALVPSHSDPWEQRVGAGDGQLWRAVCMAVVPSRHHMYGTFHAYTQLLPLSLPSPPPPSSSLSPHQTPSNSEWVLATANYGEPYVAAVRKGNVQAVQFHPEKSGSECRLLVASREGEVGIQEVSELYVAAVRKGSVCSAGHAIPPGEIRSGQRRLVIQGARPASHATIQTPFPSPLLSFPSLPAPLLFPHFSRLSPRLSPLPPLLSPSSPPFLSNPMPVVGLDILRRFLGPNRSQQANVRAPFALSPRCPSCTPRPLRPLRSIHPPCPPCPSCPL
ncbi:unnamed protein product, partial [Closterium sp. NIES-53]